MRLDILDIPFPADAVVVLEVDAIDL